MEGFLSTLPPYVHHYLDKYPATDTFNVLKELVCFAVLYSNDRHRITSLTQQLEQPISSIREETEEDIRQEQKPAKVKEKAVEVKKENTRPNTFPEWWGHDEGIPKTPTPPPTAPEKQPEQFWVTFEEKHPKRNEKTQIIPNLRSYPDLKRHSTMETANLTRSSQTSRRLSMPVCDSPAKLTSKPSRSNLNPDLKTPRPNAAMRARSEHAKQQQEDMLRKKNSSPSLATAAGMRMKDRANSGIKWDEIKKERRSTLVDK